MKTKEEITKAIDELIEEMNARFLTRDEEASYWDLITKLQDQRDAIEDKEREDMLREEKEKKARLMKGINDMLRFANEKIEGHDMADIVQVDAWSLQCMVWILTDMKKVIEASAS